MKGSRTGAVFTLLPQSPWQPARRGAITLLAVLLLALSATGNPVWGEGAAGQELPVRVPLRCRVDGGAWRDCQMVVKQMGALWQVMLAGEQFGFAHDGRGQVRMRRGQGAWTPVEARWSADATLCWDGLCAQGDIPLD